MTPTHRIHDMTIESAPDLPSQLAVKVMHEIGSNDPDLYGRIQETLNAALAAAPQPAPVDRHEMARVILTAHMGAVWAETVSHIVDALLARGLRLPGEDETLAWAVVGEDGKPNPNLVFSDEGVIIWVGEPPVRVAIRVVEGGDDAA